MNSILAKAKEVFDIEISGLNQVKNNLDENFIKLVELCLKTLDNNGKIVLSGVGKSGHIGKKIAATLSSTGSQAVFLHPVEAMHGDLGLLQENDVFLALSYSGETDELISILPAAKRLGAPIVAITGSADSALSEWGEFTVEMKVDKEACPFNLAPTTTAIALLAIGDALAMVLMKMRNFTQEDYGKYHPGGAIGKAVALHAKDIMRSGENLALVEKRTTVKDTLLAMTKAKSGSAIIVEDGKLLGIFTDGDFRRHVEDDLNVLNESVHSVMTLNPTYVRESSLAIEVLNIIEEKNIDDIVVVNNDDIVTGIIDVQDLPKVKLM